MKKTILFYSLLFVFAFSYANTNYENSISTNKISEQINKLSEDPTVENIEVVITKLDGGECTVAITGSIGYNSTYVQVNISVTAATCEEAESQAWASLNRQYKRLKAFVNNQ